MRFPRNVIVSSLEDIVNIENTRDSNQNDLDSGSVCEVRPRRQKLTSKLNLIGCKFVSFSKRNHLDLFLCVNPMFARYLLPTSTRKEFELHIYVSRFASSHEGRDFITSLLSILAHRHIDNKLNFWHFH